MSSLIQHYFPDLTAGQLKQFDALNPLYKQWNDNINVISRKDIESLYERHVLHSLAIAKVCPFKKGAEILDIGTGGGFPGIPLAILYPETEFHLVDSIGKKIKVVKEVAHELKLSNVKASHERAEKIDGKYDFVVSRAVTRFSKFLPWVKGKFKKENNHQLKNGILYLKGGDLKEELSEVKYPYKVYDIPAFFNEPFYETKKVIHVTMK